MVRRHLRRLSAGLAAAVALPLLVTSAATVVAAPAQAAPTPLRLQVVAGSGAAGDPVDGPARDSPMSPAALAVDSSGNVYFADWVHKVVGRITPSGDLSTVTGVAGTSGLATAGLPAAGQPLDSPRHLAVDSHDDLYISDFGNQVVQKVDAATGTVSFVTHRTRDGNGNTVDSPFFDHPTGVAVNSQGDVYVSLGWRQRVVQVTRSGQLSEVVGSGNRGCGSEGCGNGPDGGDAVEGPATSSQLRYPGALAVDASDDLYVADAGNRRVEKVTPAGALTFVAGSGTRGSLVDGPATASPLGSVGGLAVDAAGVLHLGDEDDARVASVTPATSGSPAQLHVVAGNGTSGAPVEGDALASPLTAGALALDPTSGALYTTAGNQVVKLTAPTPAPPGPMPWSPPEGKVGEPYSSTFTTTGHPDPTWTVVGGALPDGLTLDAATGTVSGTPTRAGSFAVTLQAVNASGALTDSTWMHVAAAPPSAPTGVTARAGAATGEAVVSWSAPASDGGADLSSYTVQWTDTSATPPVVDVVVVRGTTSGLATSTTVTGLTPGHTYAFAVTASNSWGEVGEQSAPSTPLVLPLAGTPTPRAPDAPTRVTATAGATNSGMATVRWEATTASGEPLLTSFTVQPSSTRGTPPRPVVVSSGSARSARLSGLVPGRTYTFTVTATNAAGLTSAPSTASAPLRLPIRCKVQRQGSTLEVTCPGGLRWTIPRARPQAGARQAPDPTCTATDQGARALVSCSDGRQQSFAAPL